MFDDILSCSPDELYCNIEKMIPLLKNKDDAEKLIRTIWIRVPELTINQEKEIHKLGRKIRKLFKMKPVKINND